MNKYNIKNILNNYFVDNIIISIYNTENKTETLNLMNLNNININEEINNLDIRRLSQNTIKSNPLINENNIYNYNTFLERLLFLIYLKINRNITHIIRDNQDLEI